MCVCVCVGGGEEGGSAYFLPRSFKGRGDYIIVMITSKCGG